MDTDFRYCKKCDTIKAISEFYTEQRRCINCQKEYSKYRSKMEKVDNILLLHDTHLPFDKIGYIEFCYNIGKKYNCNKFYHLGDLIDFHYSSFHPQDPDGLGAGDEWDKISKSIIKMTELFPELNIVWGNHDKIPQRKVFNAGLSSRWVKSIKDVLLEDGYNVEKWVFAPSFEIHNTHICHGIGKSAKMRSMQKGKNVAQAHQHTKSSIEYVTPDGQFALQGGCGLDRDAYAAQYMDDTSDLKINCSVILNNGTLPIIEWMK